MTNQQHTIRGKDRCRRTDVENYFLTVSGHEISPNQSFADHMYLIITMNMGHKNMLLSNTL